MGSSSVIKNVVLVGGTGNLGSQALAALLAAPQFHVTVLSRRESSAVFGANVKVIKTEYTEEKLVAAFTNQDAVVSVVGGTAFLQQKVLIDAAVKAGVKRFLPTEYSSNTQSAAVRKLVPLFEQKLEVLEYLKVKESQGLTWTGLAVGGLFDWGLNVGFLGFDFNNRTATIWDDGTTSFSLTNAATFGQAIVSVLDKPAETANKYLYISSVTTTQSEILSALEAVTSTKWNTKNVTTEGKLAEAEKLSAKGNFLGTLINVQAAAWGKIENLGGNFERDEVLSNGLLELPKETVTNTVQRVVKENKFSGAMLMP